MKFDYSELNRAMAALAADGGKSKLEVCRMAAKGFIKDIVGITPPASKGVAGMAAKKAGEAAVERDIAAIAIPVDGVPRAGKGDLFAWHQSKWQNGRIRSNGEQIAVNRADYNAIVRTLKALVGFLAAGWNAAAQKLGVKLPAWVKRHGSKFGEHRITETPTRVSIELSNVVGFVGDVKAYDRRVQMAVNYQAKKMQRQCNALLRKRLRKAGFKT